MSSMQIRTLKQDMDSGEDLRGIYYRSRIQITAKGAFIYEVAARPNGNGHFRVLPVDVPLIGDEGYKNVEIPYWQHQDDERCSSDLANQLAS